MTSSKPPHDHRGEGMEWVKAVNVCVYGQLQELQESMVSVLSKIREQESFLRT